MKMNNKNVLVIAVAIIAIIAAVVVTTSAQMSSAKTGVAGDEDNLLESGSTLQDKMGTVWIKTPNDKDLVISVSAEAILFTDTVVKGKKDGTLSSDMDTASIQVWAEIDGDGIPDTDDDAFPGPVTFAERIQTMEGKLSSVITYQCEVPGSDPVEYTLCWYDVPEEVRLMLDTTNANSFNFLALNVPQGEHNITVWAKLSADEGGDVELNNDSPKALIGKRTIVVQEVRLTQGASV